MQIVTLTMNPTIDTNATVKQVMADQKLRCGEPRHEPGGGGINVSRAIMKLAGKSRAVFTAGGANGQWLKELLTQEEIAQTPIPIAALSRENFTLFEETSDKQYRFVMPGPKLSKQECERSLDTIRKMDPTPEYIIASGSLPPGAPQDFYGRAALLGKELGARVIIDTTGEPLRHAVEKGVFMVKPNMRELKQLTQKEIADEAEMQEVVGDIVGNERSEVVVVSLGAGGAFMATGDASKYLRAPTVQIKSKVGAGDSMVAGTVLSLAQGRSLVESVQFGVAAGAAAVMTPGTELCRRQDAENLYRKMTSN